MTLEEVEKRKQKAVAFATNVLQDDDLADDLEDEDPLDYAARKGLKVSNSERRQAMATVTNAGDGSGDDYSFDDWAKTDMQDALEQVAQIACDAYDPMSSREDAMQALGDILDALSDEDEDEDQDIGDDLDDDGR